MVYLIHMCFKNLSINISSMLTQYEQYYEIYKKNPETKVSMQFQTYNFFAFPEAIDAHQVQKYLFGFKVILQILQTYL